MSHPGSAFQQALHAVLTGDAALSSLVSGVYDDAVNQATLDYITYGQSILNREAVAGGVFYRIQQELMIYSNAQSRQPTLNICERLHVLLHHQVLDCSPFTLDHLSITREVVQRDIANQSWQGRIRLLAVMR